MLAHSIFSLALLPSSFAALIAPSPATVVARPLITPGPSEAELRKRQNAADYMGIVLWSGSWITRTCSSGNTYYQSAGQWGCCSVGRAGCLNNIAVNCFDGTMIFKAASTGTNALTNSFITQACTSIWSDATDRSFTVCNTAYMYENEGDSDPDVNVVCGVSSLNWSYYRQRTNIPSPSTPSGPTRSPSVPTLTPATATPTARPEPTPIPPSGGEEKKESKAWIAGAVIGPIVGLALIGLGIFFFMRRKKNKNNQHHVAPVSGTVAAPGNSAYQQNSYPSNPGSPQPPQYYPSMQQTGGKQDGYYAGSSGPQSPLTSQGSQSPYSTAPQGWQQGAQPVYGAPSPSMSPQMQDVQPAQCTAPRHFSTELEAGGAQGQPEVGNMQLNR